MNGGETISSKDHTVAFITKLSDSFYTSKTALFYVGSSAPKFTRASSIIVFLIYFISTTIVRVNSLTVSVIDWDESLYALIADRWLDGYLPYQDIWDQHPVGLPAIFAAIFYFFPKSIIAIRLSACVTIAITASTIHFTTFKFTRNYFSAIAAAILYIGWTARLWGLSANTEIYLNALIAPAMYLLIQETQKPKGEATRLWRIYFAALLFGCALQIKHVVLAETALFCLGVAVYCRSWPWRESYRLIAIACLCLIFPTLLVLLYFTNEGLLTEYLHAVIDANLHYVAHRPPFLDTITQLPRSFLIPLSLVLLAVIRWSTNRTLTFSVIIAWAFAAGIDVTLPGHFWLHYFLLFMPPASILAGKLIGELAVSYPRLRMLALLLVVICINPIGLYNDHAKVYALARRDVPQIIATTIKDELSPKDFIFVFNYQPILYLLTEAKVPTKHAFPADWSLQFQKTSGLNPIEELKSIFQKAPVFVIVADEDWNHMGDETMTALHNEMSAYDERMRITDLQILPYPSTVTIYHRKDH